MKKNEIIDAIKALGFVALVVNETATVEELKALHDQLTLQPSAPGISGEDLDKAVAAAKAESESIITEKDKQLKELTGAVGELNTRLSQLESAPSRTDRTVTVKDKKYQIVSGVNLLVEDERVIFSADDLMKDENSAILIKLVEQGSGALKELED